MEIRIREGNLFLPFRRSVHAGSNHVNLAAAQGRDEGVETEALDFDLGAHLFADGIGQVDIKTDILVVFCKFKRRECRFHADDEGLLFT